ncbi:MAG: RNA polymerase sigma factor [Gemmataceae bacterium]
MDSTSISLLERLRRRHDEGAWEHFVQLYTPLLCHWVARLGHEGQDAADLVQDIFTVLVRKMPEFRYDPDKRFRAWLWTVALNCCRERVRRQQVPIQPGEPGLLSRATIPDVAEEVADEEYRRYLTRRAMELMQVEFQPATWKAFWEYVVNQRPAAEVAEELGLTENAVYLAKGRVLRRLREELKGLLD